MLISNPFKKDFWSFYNFEIVKATVNKSVGGPSRKEFFKGFQWEKLHTNHLKWKMGKTNVIILGVGS
jgi:hypothetical protein